MLLPLTIGQTSSGIPISHDLSRMPHLFLSYADRAGADAFFAQLWTGWSDQGCRPLVAAALTHEEAVARIPVPQRTWLFCSLLAGSEDAGPEAFFTRLLAERRRRMKVKGSHPPLLVLIDDLFHLLASPKRRLHNGFLQLLVEGPAAGMHLIAASGGPFRQLLRQVCRYDPRLQQKFTSIHSSAYPASAFGAELVLTGEELVYYKTPADADYQRLYPLCGRRLLKAL